MKNNKILLILLLCLAFAACKKEEPAQPGTTPSENNRYLVQVLEDRRMTAEEVRNCCQEMAGSTVNFSLFKIPWHDVRILTLKYRTTDGQGKPAEASGVLAFRSDIDHFDGIYSVQHATCELKDAPSRLTFSLEATVCMWNYIVCEADYMGYGYAETADRFIPYLNAECAGNNCRDMLYAAKEYLASQQIAYTDSTHLIGYSQGGAATIALLRALEAESYPRIGRINAGGCPFSLRTTLQEVMKDSAAYSNYRNPVYALLIFRSMDESYQLHLDWSKLFKPGYERAIDWLSSNTFAEMNQLLGHNARAFLSDDFFRIPEGDSLNPELSRLYAACDRNDLVRHFAPQHQVNLFHTPHDDIVAYANAQQAVQAHSAYHLTNLSANNHFNGIFEFYLHILLTHP